MTIDDNNPRALLRWAIQHATEAVAYEHKLTEAQRRALFARRVLLRDDRTVRRWLDKVTEIPAEVVSFLKSRRAMAKNPERMKEKKRKLTARDVLWGRWL